MKVDVILWHAEVLYERPVFAAYYPVMHHLPDAGFILLYILFRVWGRVEVVERCSSAV
jgi:hypothetical protein